MSLRAKFSAASALIAVLAIGLAVFGMRALSATNKLVIRLYDEPLMGVNYARAASATLNEARGLMERSLLLEPDAASGNVALLRRMENDIADDLRIVRARMHDASVTAALNGATASITGLFRDVDMILVGSREGVTALPMPSAVEQQSAIASARLDDLAELVAANGFTYRSRAVMELRASSITLASLAGGIIAMSTLFVLLFAHLLIRPIRAATRIAEDVAAGNIATVVASTRRDEIGRLLSCLATMQVNLLDRDARARALLRENIDIAAAQRQTNLRFDAALNNMSHGLVMCDKHGKIVVINQRFCEISGVDPDSILPNAPYRDVLALSVAAGNHPGRTADEVFAEQTLFFQSHRPTTITKTNHAGRTVEISFEPMPDGGWIATQADITERRKSEEQIIFLARHDALTRLPNRVIFHERLNQALARAERGESFALLYLDLDRFKTVNDTLGHLIGDSLLQAVAIRLQDTVREVDTVARLGGDEFAILQVGAVMAAEASLLACRVLEVISRPYEIEGHQVAIGVSIGIALAPSDSMHPVQLMKNADLALYRAKQDGRDTWRFFEPAMDALARARRELEFDLRNALSLGQLELYYQPLVSSRGRNLTGFEVLLRWHHPTRGMVLPGDFICVAEEIGLIVPIGAWVLRQACAEAATWPDHLRVAVNLSPLQFRGETLVPTVSEAMRASGILATRLEFEITESVRLQDDQMTRSTLHTLRALGARIALDDFGTGYSSLSYLRSFPFDTIKIDRSFVSGLGSREDCSAIVRAIVALGNSLHMHTTAEGVETEEQFEFLAAVGCNEIQGYLFSKPVPGSAVPALIERLSPPTAALPAPAEVFVS